MSLPKHVRPDHTSKVVAEPSPEENPTCAKETSHTGGIKFFLTPVTTTVCKQTYLKHIFRKKKSKLNIFS